MVIISTSAWLRRTQSLNRLFELLIRQVLAERCLHFTAAADMALA